MQAMTNNKMVRRRLIPASITKLLTVSYLFSKFVIPAKAGIQALSNWFSAFAGKTAEDEMTSVVNTSMRLLIFLICLISTHVYGGSKKMEHLYDFKEAVSLTPQTYQTGMSDPLSLFPVPMDKAVGTNDIRNAISIISFPKGKIDIEHYFKRAIDDVQGGGTYLPVITQDLIGFGQMRAFYLFNFKRKIHEEYRIVFSIDQSIENIAIADADRRRFIFEIKEYNSNSSDHHDKTYSLRLIDLYKREINLIKTIDIGKGSIWVKAQDKVLLWFFDEKEMQVFDMNLQPSQHPLAELIKKNKDKVDFTRLAHHPSLPFVILYGGGKTLDTLLIWGEGKNKSPQTLLSEGGDQFSFSPDGMWVTFRRYVGRGKENTYLMPVSEKYPSYLGSPILLINDYFNTKNFAWTTNPICFIGNNGRTLYRWELTKEAQKSMMGNDADKYPTFHDYIVAKDLEKLTKEKKQGLGK